MTILAHVFMSKRISAWTFRVLFIWCKQRWIWFRKYSHDGSRRHILAI